MEGELIALVLVFMFAEEGNYDKKPKTKEPFIEGKIRSPLLK